MIPILYAGKEQSFLNNGLGRLSDAISCKVTEERNGTFELEMTYPITGIHYKDIALNKIILAKTEEGGSNQAFIIYSITRPISGIVSIKANHISYLLNGFVVMPFDAVSLADAMSKINPNTVVTIPFTFSTDITSDINFSFDTPRSIRSLLGGEQGSLLDTYGGYDYRFDNFQVSLLADRGNDNGVVLRYGKNLTELKNLDNTTNVYTGIVPYWKNDTTTLYLPERVVLSGHESDYPYKIIKTVDFSQEFENEPTEAQLRAKAQSYLENNRGWALKNNIDVSFVALWQSEEYKDIAALERVRMCDTVRVVYSKLGVDIKTRVIKTVYNVLLERYDSISLGDATYNLTQAIQETIMEPEIQRNQSFTKDAVARATKLIQGGLGGHVVFNTNGDGEPQEILIMDTDSIETAVNVIRMNLNGIGFSHNGYAGPFTTAWTVDGHFVADFIDTGNLNAGLLKVGTITDGLGYNHWNLQTGEFSLSALTQVGNSTIASASDVSGAIGIAERYADGAASNAETAAKGYADGVASNAETAAKGYADGALSAYDLRLNQQAVFNKLTNNGAAQGIFLQNGELYINGTFIQAQTIGAEALTVEAKEALSVSHDYLSADIFDDISTWEHGVETPYYETIDNVKYLVLDGTAINSFDSEYYVRTLTDIIGDINFDVKFTYRVDRDVTVATRQRFPFVNYMRSDQQGRVTWKWLEAQTLNEGQDYTVDGTFNISDVDPTSACKFGIYYIPGCKLYITGLSVTSRIDTYVQTGLAFNEKGLEAVMEEFGYHNYLPYDRMTNADRWDTNATDISIALTTMTFDGESHDVLVLDGTNVIPGTVRIAKIDTDLIGLPTFTLRYKYRFAQAYTASAMNYALLYYLNGSGQSVNLGMDYHAQTDYAASTTYSAEVTVTITDAIDYFEKKAELEFKFHEGVIVYIFDIELVGSFENYKKSTLRYTTDGLDSTVQAGMIISTIN